jgi:hypothetical protein
VAKCKVTAGGNIVMGGQVSASLGKLLPVTPGRLAATNTNYKRKPRKKRKLIFDSVVGILGANKYKVHFCDGTERECCSNSLKSHRHAPPEDALQIAEGGFHAGETCPASLKQLEVIAACAAADSNDVFDEEEHLPYDDEINQDLLWLVDHDGSLESSDNKIRNDESTFHHPIANAE